MPNAWQAAEYSGLTLERMDERQISAADVVQPPRLSDSTHTEEVIRLGMSTTSRLQSR